MHDMTAVRERYLRDGLPVRLGGPAANVACAESFSHNATSQEAVHCRKSGILGECASCVQGRISLTLGRHCDKETG